MTPAYRTSVLLVNIGSPDTPTTPAVRKYLDEFLMDGRVLDYPAPLRRLIVSGFILPSRPARSAEAYQAIWWDTGSPLIVITDQVKDLLREELNMPVEIGMRYGNPSLENGLRCLLSQGIDTVYLVPMYPHYAMSTYETCVEETRHILGKLGPDIRLIVQPPFYEEPLYMDALFASAADYLDWDFDHLLFSYHGLPVRHLKKSDPTGAHCMQTADCCSVASPARQTCYRHQVLYTTHTLTERAGVPPEKYSFAFQSRLGRDTWMQPFTAEEFIRLAQSGVKKLLVITPAFVTDCLETLEEIGIRGKADFLAAGGKEFRLIPCMNTHPQWIIALKTWIMAHEEETR
ncbi:MAG: ferrochelatase [Anaerolineales bacterium]|nr:ferrochelatase [Anaerolineales bacterium]